MYRSTPEQENIWEDQSLNNLNVVFNMGTVGIRRCPFLTSIQGVFMSKDTNNTSRNRVGIVMIAVFLIIIVLIISGYIYIKNATEALDKNSTDEITVNIEQGSGTEAIANILKENGIISNTSGFKFISRIKGNDGKYKAGVYLLSPSMNTDEIMKILMEGKQDIVKIVVPEGYTLKQIAEKAEEAGVCTKEEFIKETQQGNFDRDCVSAMQSEAH